jgi:hypothetical protein
MFDDDDTTVRVVFASAIQHDIKPRRLTNVSFNPFAKVNVFAIRYAQWADPTFEVHWEDRTLYSNGVLVGKFSRRHRVFVEFGIPQRHSLSSWWGFRPDDEEERLSKLRPKGYGWTG